MNSDITEALKALAGMKTLIPDIKDEEKRARATEIMKELESGTLALVKLQSRCIVLASEFYFLVEDENE